MRRLLQENMIPALWIAFALYWVLAAVRQRRAKPDESLTARLFCVMLAVIAFRAARLSLGPRGTLAGGPYLALLNIGEVGGGHAFQGHPG